MAEEINTHHIIDFVSYEHNDDLGKNLLFEIFHANSCITANDILKLAEWIKENNISLNTPVFISEINEGLESRAVNIKADNNSINFYDWM